MPEEVQAQDQTQQDVLRTIYDIDVNKIKTGLYQPRRHFDENAIERLAESIKESGLHNPIIIKTEENGDVVLVAGERRLRACKKLKMQTIRAIVTNIDTNEATKADAMAVALIDNVTREDITPIEESLGIKRLMDEHGYSQKDVAGIIGKAESTVSELKSICEIGEDLRDEIMEVNPKCARWILLEMAKHDTTKLQRAIYEEITENDLSREVFKKGEAVKKKREKLIETVDGIPKRLDNLKFKYWDEDERGKLSDSLRTLQSKIEEMIETEEE